MKGCEQLVKCIINGCIAMSKPGDVNLTKNESEQNGVQQNDQVKKQVTKVDKLAEPIKVTKVLLNANGNHQHSGIAINGRPRSVLIENDFSYIDEEVVDGGGEEGDQPQQHEENFNTVRKRPNPKVEIAITTTTTHTSLKRNDPQTSSDKIPQNPCKDRNHKNQINGPQTMRITCSDNSRQLDIHKVQSRVGGTVDGDIKTHSVDIYHSKIDRHTADSTAGKCEDLTHNRQDFSVNKIANNNDKGSTDCRELSENASSTAKSTAKKIIKFRPDQDECRQKINSMKSMNGTTSNNTSNTSNTSNKTQKAVEIINKCSNGNSRETEQPNLHTNDNGKKCKTEDMPVGNGGGDVASSMVDNSSSSRPSTAKVVIVVDSIAPSTTTATATKTLNVQRPNSTTSKATGAVNSIESISLANTNNHNAKSSSYNNNGVSGRSNDRDYYSGRSKGKGSSIKDNRRIVENSTTGSVQHDTKARNQSDRFVKLSVSERNHTGSGQDHKIMITSDPKVVPKCDVKNNKNSVSSENQSAAMDSNASVNSKNEDHIAILCLNKDNGDEEDPYTELEIYLEKVKREINEVFEQRKVLNDRLPRSMVTDSDGNKNNKLHQETRPCLLLDDIRTNNNNNSNNNKKLNKISCSSSTNNTKSHGTNHGSTTMSLQVLSDYGQEDEDEVDEVGSSEQIQKQQRILATCRRNLANIKARVQAEAESNATTDVNVWANSILKELDNLVGSDKGINAHAGKDSSSCSDSSGCIVKSPTRKCISMPEKHTTIPLYSFNLDHPLLESSNAFNSKKPPIDYTRKPSLIGGATNSSLTNNNNNNNNNTNNSISHITSNGNSNSNKGQSVYNGRQAKDIVTVLKIEEDTEGDRERTVVGSLSTQVVSIQQPKKEIILSQPSTLILNDGTKKGSTSTIWTSEESILRSVGAVDEDNKSTSSSACDEASGALSSGKSRNSLNSSELDNENVESGIGTATPPKELEYWKNFRTITSNTNTNTSTVSSNGYTVSNASYSPVSRQSSTGLSTNSHPLQRFGHKNYSNTSSDEHDLLEVLSLCDATSCDDDIINNECDIFDGIDTKSIDDDEDIVILRNRLRSEYEGIDHTYSMPSSRAKKARSHSIEASQFPLSRNDFDPHDKEFRTYKARRPCCLPINQEPFQNNTSSNMRELPSPSSASLHSGHGNLVLQELTTKSNSAPILLKKEKRRDDFCTHQNSLRYSRSQSDRYLAEIEAIEACKWLRAAGFPQYAQMYEDLQFPIDLNNVAKDHPMLETDPLQSLYRRLCILNRCATMRLDSTHKQHGEQKDDSDDEGFTLSENWTFQPQSRRWSRVGEMGLEIQPKQPVQPEDCSSKDSSPDRFEDDMVTSAHMDLATHALSSSEAQNDAETLTIRFRRTGSERLKDGAKAFLRRVESIKSRRRKRQNREGLVISGPHVLDLSQMNQKVNDLKCIDVTTYSNPPSPTSTSPMHFSLRPPFAASNELKVPNDLSNDRFLSPHRLSPKHIPITPRSAQSTRSSPLHFFHTTMPHLKEGKSDDSSSYCSDSQESSSGGSRFVLLRRQASRSRRFLRAGGKVDDVGALSDSECHQSANKKIIYKDANSNDTEVQVSKLNRGGSLNLGKESKRYRDALQSRSFRCRSAVRKGPKNSESDKEDTKPGKSPIQRWHSFQNHDRPQLIFKKCFTNKSDQSTLLDHEIGTTFASMSSGQLQVIRKLALVTLTGYMERYCPTHRSGWNWELPKFIKKIKTPDYKDKKVFGVPLLLVVQRSGNSLPKSIRSAVKWLEMNALDQIGLFRKSGVKSRITKLKEVIETSSDDDYINLFDTQQAYDVADMLKQYFRDLPESLLTAKMSETFVAIFQHLPPEVRTDAVQSAVLLLPDEHREVLFALLQFLGRVAENSKYNQMTANNLAVCLAPSLFNSSIVTGRASSVSPRRRKATGVPDAKELSETRASHECLTFMILHYEQIFTASKEKMARCKFSYMEESKPVPLEALGKEMQFHNWKGYLYECTSSTIKEGRDKSRGWITITSLDSNIEISYKKVGDGHPLRLWRFLTEIDGTPNEILNFILNERQCWDPSLLSSRIVEKLDERSEIFQYACDGSSITDYCVLRSWQRDLPRGACVIVETSVDHPGANLLLGGVRGVVLVSRYLIEPVGNGRSRLMHLARVDTKGRTPEWYNKSYGHICSHHLTKIRTSFQNGVIITSANKS